MRTSFLALNWLSCACARPASAEHIHSSTACYQSLCPKQELLDLCLDCSLVIYFLRCLSDVHVYYHIRVGDAPALHAEPLDVRAAVHVQSVRCHKCSIMLCGCSAKLLRVCKLPAAAMQGCPLDSPSPHHAGNLRGFPAPLFLPKSRSCVFRPLSEVCRHGQQPTQRLTDLTGVLRHAASSRGANKECLHGSGCRPDATGD